MGQVSSPRRVSPRLRLLLASSSLAAMMAGGGAPAFAVGICGSNFFNGASVGAVTNSSPHTCIYVVNSTIAGNVSNTSTLTTKSPSKTGITINNSTIHGTISNSGAIHATQIGIFVNNNATVSGGISNSGALSAGSNGIIISNVTTFSGGLTNSGTLSAGGVGVFVSTVSSFAGGVTNSGTLSAGGGGIFLGPVLSFADGIANNGTLSAGADGILVLVSSFAGGIANRGQLSAGEQAIVVQFATTFAGGISNSGSVLPGIGSGIVVNEVSAFSGGIANSGTISGRADAINLSFISIFAGGISNSGTLIGNTGIALGLNVSTFSGAIVNSGNITGTGGTAINVSNGPTGITIDQQAGTVTGAINLSANDTVNVGGGVINGNILGGGAGDTINFALGSGTFTYGAADRFSNIAAVNVTSGTVILDGQNAATTTNVTGGNLQIGDAASSGAQLVSTVDVDGGTLSGHGSILGGVTVNPGGTLAPGGSIGTLTIAGGPLTFAAGSTYSVQISDIAASKTLVNGAPGTVTINGGTVVVTPQYTLGTHGGTTFTILTASGGRSGQFSPVVANVPNFTGALSLSYDADDVFLNVGKGYELLPQAPGGNANQSQVVTGINGAIMTGVTVPANFQTLQTLSGPAYLTALTQLDGEVATGANVSASQLTGEFLNLMLDPFIDGRGGSQSIGNGALGFAPDQRASLPPDAALAYAGVLKAPAASASGGGSGFNQRWSTWASGFGGSATTSGNAAVGSNNVTTSTYGYAAGMDYHTSPDTVLGFALAGGGTNWNLANALGTGRSDSFLAGVYGVTHNGPWYFAGALSFANNWFTTNRTAMSDQLTAKFQGQNYAARLEGGYRFAVPTPSLPSPASGGGLGWGLGITPYAAIQAQDFHTPAYSETDVTGGGFGLSYNARNGTDARSELGSRFDDLTALDNMPLVLRARVAWAHDWVSNPALTAAFETLPGSSFTVNGAPIPRDSALTSAGAQLFFTPHWSLLAKFDGQFAGGSQLYAGTGTLRYTW